MFSMKGAVKVVYYINQGLFVPNQLTCCRVNNQLFRLGKTESMCKLISLKSNRTKYRTEWSPLKDARFSHGFF